MRVVRRIFYLVGVENRTLHAVSRALKREGEKSPDGKPQWATPVIRHLILNDVYKPHSYEETAKLVSTEVVARLEPHEVYGIWWYNRHRITRKQIADVVRVDRCRRTGSAWRGASGFLADYEAHFIHNRYVGGSLPRLPFFDGTFDLVLCAHLLFTYAARFDFDWHLAACRELVRVSADEVRIHPLCGLTASRTPGSPGCGASCARPASPAR